MKRENPMSTDEFRERISPEERQKYLDERLRELVTYAYEKAPALKERMDKAGISPSKVSSIKDLEGLSPLRKDQLPGLDKANPPFGGLVTLPVEELDRVYVSPGPIYDPHHKSERYWRRHIQIMKGLGVVKGDIILNTWAYHLMPMGLMVFDEPMRRAGATVIPTGTGNTELQVEIMHHLKATGFCGTPTFFMTIIRRAEEMGYDIRKDFNLRLAIIGAEMGGGPIREMVEQKYGVYARDYYGTAEAGLFAFECSEKTGMHLAEEIIVEIVDPETGKTVSPGEVGEVLFTPIDETYPLLRFGTGDLAALSYEPCPCGRTSPRLTRILGRIGDAVRTRGAFIHPRELEPALAKFSELARYQAVVTRPAYRDEFVLKAELKGEEGVNKEKLTEELKKAVSDAVRIRLDRVEFVAKGVIPEEHKLIVDERVY